MQGETDKASEKAGWKLNIQKTKIMASGPIASWQIDGETMETATDFIFLGSKITTDGDCSHEVKRCLLLGRKAMTKLDSILKNRDITLLTKVRIVKTMVFPVVIQMWELDHKEGWAPRIDAFKVWCLEKTLEIPLDCKDIKPDNHKGDLSWIFIGRTDAKAKAPILWPPYVKNGLIRKDPDDGKDLKREKGTKEDEMVGWHYQLDGYEFEQTPGVGNWQGSLACYSPWGHRELDTIGWLNWTSPERRYASNWKNKTKHFL